MSDISGSTISGAWNAYVPMASVIGGFATGFGLALAFVTIGVAIWQVRYNNSISREMDALETYREYLRLCVEHPQLSCYSLAVKTLPSQSMIGVIGQLTTESEKYLWFFSVLLNACEKILLTSPRDTIWISTVDAQLSYHEGTLMEVWPAWNKLYSTALGKRVDFLLSRGAAGA